MTDVTSTHCSVTICNTLWGSGLSFSSFSAGDPLLAFDSLFPEEETLVDICREAGLDKEPLELCKLLLASESYRTLNGVLKSGVVCATQQFSPGLVTLAHLACALALPQAIYIISSTENESTNNSSLWTLRDQEGRLPKDVCFNPEVARKLPHKTQKIVAGQLLHPEKKHRVFQLASNPDNFYPVVVSLQTYQFNVDRERDSSGNLLIHTAVQGGLPSLPLLLALLNHFKADINARDRNGLTPLSLACRLGHLRVAEVLICVGGADMKVRDPDLGRTALHFAVLNDHPDIVRMLLHRGADASAEDKSNCNAAFLARKAEFHECQRILSHHMKERISTLASQAVDGTLKVTHLYPSDVCQVTDEGDTLLILAAKHGHAHLLSQLVVTDNCPLDYQHMKTPDLLDSSMQLSAGLQALPECGDHPKKTALHYACQEGHSHCVRILLKAHAHPSIPDFAGYQPLHYACNGEHVDCVRAILSYQGILGLSGLRFALSLANDRGNKDIIALLQEAMTRRQVEHVTPALFNAAVSGNTELLYSVLEDGDDVNPMKADTRDWPLLLAAGGGHLDIVRYIYKFGGHVTQSHPKSGLTPLHVAAHGGWENVVKYLLEFTEPQVGGEVEGDEEQGGKNINCRNKTGATPLEMAAVQGHKNVVQLLLDSGASCCLPDSTGRLLKCEEFSGIQFILEQHRGERIQAICEALKAAVPLSEFQRIWQGPWDYNLHAKSGDTVLMVAAEHAPLEVVRFLLQAASHAQPGVLVAGGTPTPLQGQQVIEESDSTSDSDTRAPNPPRKVNIPPIVRRQSWRFSFQKARNKLRLSSLARRRKGGSVPSGTGYVSSGDEEQKQLSHHDSRNTGICCTIIREVNVRDGQTALHRAAVGGQHENVTLLLETDPECALAKDLNGDTALHIACRNTGNNRHRKTVEALLACDKVEADVKNNKNQLPEQKCPHSKTCKAVIKRRKRDAKRRSSPHVLFPALPGPRLDLPTPPPTDPPARKGLEEKSETASVSTSCDRRPSPQMGLNTHMGELKQQCKEDCVTFGRPTYREGLKAKASSVTSSSEGSPFYPDFRRQEELNKQLEELKRQCRDMPTSDHGTVSAPRVDPDNTTEFIPACFSPVATLSDCTHDGRLYYDEHHGFGLEIPAAAIPEGESITIDIGVALHGPFQYPEGLRPVSPVFWVCVRDQKNFQFVKPVKVTIPHCLNPKYNDIGLTFLNGDHEMNSQQKYQLQQTEDVLIEPPKRYGVIQTTHFCCLCLSCIEIPEFFERASFCICSVIPEKFFPRQFSHAYFFITLLLPTCLTTVENQIEKLGYKEIQQDEFQISSVQTLEICFPQSPPAEWRVGMRGKEKIMMSDVDFFVKDFCENTKHELEVREKRGMYPPRFHVIFSCSSSARQSQTKIEFRGAVTNLVFDVFLTPTVTSPSVPISPISIGGEQGCIGAVEQQASAISPTRPAVPSPIDSDNSATPNRGGLSPLGERPTMPVLLRLRIPQEVGDNYCTFGIFLLNDQTGGKVDTFREQYHGNAEGVVRRILREWLEGKGLPVTWDSLINVLKDTNLLTMAHRIQENLQ